MNYWEQHGYPSKVVLVMFTGAGGKYYHAQSLWIDFQTGVIAKTTSVTSRWDIHDPGCFAVENEQPTVVEWWDSKLKCKRPPWIENGMLKEDQEVPAGSADEPSQSVIFPKGTPVRFLNKLVVDSMSGRILELRENVCYVTSYPYLIGQKTFCDIKRYLPKLEYFTNHDGGTWESYKIDTGMIGEPVQYPRDARTKAGRVQRKAADEWSRDILSQHKWALRHRIKLAIEYGNSSCVSYVAKFKIVEHLWCGKRSSIESLMVQTPKSNRRSRHDILKFWLKKARHGRAEVPAGLDVKHKERHQMIDRLRQELWRDSPNPKAVLKGVRRYVAKYRLPTTATRRLLQMLAASSALRDA